MRLDPPKPESISCSVPEHRQPYGRIRSAVTTSASQRRHHKREINIPPPNPMASSSTTRAEQTPLLPAHRDDRQSSQREHASLKDRTARFLASKAGHYSVLALVSLDITGIFTAFILQLFTCEGHIAPKTSAQAEQVIDVASLVFSCLFVLELGASVWVFGWKYFHSKFHCLDAAVILVGFVVDVLLKGVLEEIGSLVVVMRLWRVFKIIEELSAGAEQQMAGLQRQITLLENENKALSAELRHLKTK